MKTAINTSTTPAAHSGALKRCASVLWQVSRRLGVLCWAIGVAVINLGEH
ncbi:hypothetical protein [Cerasicoccus fimbriatus]|nr:hypothetical protein [Cerasicoccus sp. TK19100]